MVAVARCTGRDSRALPLHNHLLIVETTGAHSVTARPHGARLAAQAAAKGALDRTAYGEARHSPQGLRHAPRGSHLRSRVFWPTQSKKQNLTPDRRLYNTGSHWFTSRV